MIIIIYLRSNILKKHFKNFGKSINCSKINITFTKSKLVNYYLCKRHQNVSDYSPEIFGEKFFSNKLLNIP